MVNRKDFRPTNTPSEISEKDRKLIKKSSEDKGRYIVAVKLKGRKNPKVFGFKRKEDAKSFIKDVKKYPNVDYALGTRYRKNM